MIGHPERLKRRKAIAAYVKSRGGTFESVNAASEKWDEPRYRVYVICREFGVRYSTAPRSGGNNRTYVVIAALCATDNSFADVAMVCNVTPNWVREVYAKCRKAGVPVRVRTRGSEEDNS